MMLCAVGMFALATTGCGELEPIVEPEIVDLQLTMDTLRTQVRDTQRSLTEVRAELESRRQELADAQVARAQLEGRVREAERRVSEARHVIEVQREELLAARAERERVFRSSSQLHGQMKQLQRAAKPVTPPVMEPNTGFAPTGASLPWSLAMPSPAATPAVNSFPTKRPATAAALRQNVPMREIIVMPGDTLWSLARKYRMGLNRLRSINQLTDNQIEVGQTLMVSDHRAFTGPSAESNP
ncbi:MAG TPA: LysM peptidoglycan-binding domain-containing protein [Nitrospira sp.]|nr:LysM peptidoglycan-binding domain-containing protein [Nitrospira sp.]